MPAFRDLFIERLPLLAALPPELRRGWARLFPLRRFRREESVFEEGARGDAAWLLRSGLVKAVKHSPKPEAFAMEVIVPGRLFGAIAVLDDKPFPVSAVALRPSEAYLVPAASFRDLVSRHPAFARLVYSQLGDHLRHAQALRSLAKEPVERRVAYVLCLLHESVGRELSLRREDVAELAGCTVETAIRTLVDFRRRKLVGTGWKRLTLLAPGRLKELAGL